MPKKTIALVLVLVMAALCACGKNINKTDDNAEPDTVPAVADVAETETGDSTEKEPAATPAALDVTVSISLEKLGEISNADFDPDDINGYDSSSKKYTILDYMGNNNLNDTYDKISYVSDSDGLFIVCKTEKMPNGVGLVGRDGTVYIDCDASLIDPLSNRFFGVYYAEKQASNEEEALLYVSSENTVSLSKREGDAVYSGYLSVYDTEKKEFVPGIKITKNQRFHMLSEECFYHYSDGSNIIYDAEGNLVKSFVNNSPKVVDDFVICVDNDWTHVYDENGNRLFSTIHDVSAIYDGKYFAEFENSEYHLYDSNENPITNIGFEFAPEYNGYFFWERKADSNIYGCIDITGNVIVDFTAENIYAAEGEDYLIVENGDNVSYVLTNGTIITEQELSEKMSEIDEINDSIITDRDTSTHLYSVYAFPSCEKLLSDQYYAVKNPRNSNLLYCKTAEGVWEVYRIVFSSIGQ